MENKTQNSKKVLPFSKEAEKSLIGVLLIQSSAWDKVESKLVASDFYDLKHQLIFQAISKMHAKQIAIDMLTVVEFLQNRQEIERAGGDTYVYSLADQAPMSANIVSYATIIHDKALLRSLQEVASKVVDSVYYPDGRTSDELLQQAEADMFAISNNRDQSNAMQPIGDILAVATERIDQLYHSGQTMTGAPTGYTDFDKMTSGLQPGDLIIVAGRPSMGKTIFGVNICEYVAIATKKPCVFFSLEMPSESIVMRMLSSLGRIKQERIRSGKLKDEDWPRMTSAIGLLSEASIFIDDTGGISPTELRSRARKVAREHGDLGVIVVDYLQLMRVPELRDNRVQEISEISRSLKLIAKELNVPLIALSQLNRSLENRQDRRPVNSDLRESGSIEQDADVIAFIYRDEVYNSDSPDKGTAEIIIGKQRNGPIGMVRLSYLGEYVRFDNYANEVMMDSEDRF
ncbi:MAG: replicative DNA helicase [Pseudomonadota bacterium]|nr:replicative DNA helicase [Pseudomonadota bacterium]